MWVVEAGVRQQVETELGAPLPDPSTPAFAQLLGDLQHTQPELAGRLLEGLRTAPSVMLPSEAFVHRMRRRRLFRDFLTRFFYKPAWPDEVVLDKRRVLGFALILFACVFLPAIYFLNGTSFALRRVPTSRVDTVEKPPTAMMGNRTASVADPSPQDRLLAVPRLSQPPSSLPPMSPPLPLPRRLSGRQPEGPGPLSYTFRQPPSAEFRTGSSTGFPSAVGTVEASAPRVFAFVAADDQPQTLRVFAFAQNEEVSRGPTLGVSGPLTTTSANVPGALVGTPDADVLPRQLGVSTAELAVRPGQVIGVRLVTGIALVKGLEPSPFVAVSDMPRWCGAEVCPEVTWLGHAAYSGGGRVQLQISAAVVNRRMYAVRAVALGPDMIAGLPAAVATETPTVAGQIIAAALAAVNDYLRVLEQQRRVTVTNEWLTVTPSAAPDFWTQLLSRITDVVGFSPSRGATVEVVEVAPMTAVRFLVLTSEGR